MGEILSPLLSPLIYRTHFIGIDVLPTRVRTEQCCQRRLPVNQTGLDVILVEKPQASRVEPCDEQIVGECSAALKYVCAAINEYPARGAPGPAEVAPKVVIVEDRPGNRMALDVLRRRHRKMLGACGR